MVLCQIPAVLIPYRKAGILVFFDSPGHGEGVLLSSAERDGH